jgi:hypothetical protein
VQAQPFLRQKGANRDLKSSIVSEWLNDALSTEDIIYPDISKPITQARDQYQPLKPENVWSM